MRVCDAWIGMRREHAVLHSSTGQIQHFLLACIACRTDQCLPGVFQATERPCGPNHLCGSSAMRTLQALLLLLTALGARALDNGLNRKPALGFNSERRLHAAGRAPPPAPLQRGVRIDEPSVSTHPCLQHGMRFTIGLTRTWSRSTPISWSRWASKTPGGWVGGQAATGGGGSRVGAVGQGQPGLAGTGALLLPWIPAPHSRILSLSVLLLLPPTRSHAGTSTW